MNSAVGRSCDACTACCFTHAVAGVKPGVAWCPIATLARAAASISIVPHNAATAHVAGSRVSGAMRMIVRIVLGGDYAHPKLNACGYANLTLRVTSRSGRLVWNLFNES